MKIIISDLTPITKVIMESKKFEEEVTFYEFFNETRNILKQFLTQPNNVKLNQFWSNQGITLSKLKHYLFKYKILIYETKLTDDAKVQIQYFIPKGNFKLRVRKLYIRLFNYKKENNQEETLAETDCGGAIGGGGQYSAPLGDGGVISRKPIETIIETADSTISSDAQYSTPCFFNKDNKNYRFSKKPTYKGGKIIGDPIIKGGTGITNYE